MSRLIVVACLLTLASPAFAAPAPLLAGDGIATTSTSAGQVQGFVDDGITTFRGIPYASAERFEPAHEVAPWPGKRLSLNYGNICPQPVSANYNELQTFVSDTSFWPQSDKCLNLNVWTPALDGKRRPVMVWLHGGGYFAGSSHENAVYDGHNLSKSGNVVVISVNHRLNIMGFLDLSAYGEAYRGSANLGISDLVQALRWVKANAAAFGGDPDNVTIFGQSGGGGKVQALMTTPYAKGLFQKAIIESGASGPGINPREGDQAIALRVAQLVFAKAGLKDGDIAGLKALPYEALNAAGDKALREISTELEPGRAGILGFPLVNWGPIVDHDVLPENPFAEGAPAASKGIPLIVGSTLNEFQLIGAPDWKTWDTVRAETETAKRFGPNAAAVKAAFAKAYPGMSLAETLTVDLMFRSGALRVASAKAAAGDKVWNYLFAWKSPVLGGAWAAGHSMEIAFVFDNVSAGRQSTGGGSDVARLSAEMSKAWVNFARTGNPNGPGVTAWSNYTAQQPATMLFDTPSGVRTGFDADLLSLAMPRNR